VPPPDWAKTVATFSGGFQRRHGQFLRGPLSQVNKSSVYGFIEDGVVMSTPYPGLSTIVVYNDETVALKTWTEEDNRDLNRIRYLRQNGVPLIEPDASGAGIPGEYVGNRSQGNWSGSAEGDNYTPRGGACLIERAGGRYLVYAYFSAATPNAMARVFQAYGCKQAIHLDMNSPGQAYLALITLQGGAPKAQHLVKAMAGSDPARSAPRYFGAPDFRDFFWVKAR
jgi:hypothetical protein